MEKLFERDSTVKLVSVLLALILWLQVSREVPESQKSIAAVPVQVRDLPPGLEAVEISPAAVTVVVRGRGRLLGTLSKDDFVAQVDLGVARPGRAAYRVDRVTVPKGVTLVGFSPEEVFVTLEALAEKEVPVSVRLQGAPAAGFALGPPAAVPERVVVRGRESVLAGLVSAEVAVPVAGVRETLTVRRPVDLLDARGEPLAGLRATPDLVAVTVPVRETGAGRQVPVRPAVTGQPAPGYAVLRVEAVPSAVTVTGPDGTAAEVTTEPVSIQGARRDVLRRVRLVAPAGTAIEGDAEVDVRVRIGAAGR